MKTFSIVIPALNAAKTLSACLDSVHQLQYPLSHLEVIVVDGGSIDNTLAIAEAHQVRVIEGACERQAEARNVGAAMAEMDYLLFADADCLIPKDLLSHAVEKLLFYDLYGTWIAPKDSQNWIAKTWLSAKKPNNGLQHALSAGVLIISKANFKKIGGFNPHYRTDSYREFCLHARALGFNLYHDAHITSIDIDQPQNLKAFFNRELQHGASKLALFRDYGLGEVSGAIALYFGLIVTAVVLVIGILGFNLSLLFWVVAVWLFVALGLSLIQAGQVNLALENESKINNIWHLTVLYFLFLMARGLALFRYHQVDDLLRVSSR